MKCILDGNQISSREELFEVIREQLPCPDYFGNNLDALCDILSESEEEVEFEIIDSPALMQALGDKYFGMLMRLLEDFGYEEEEALS